MKTTFIVWAFILAIVFAGNAIGADQPPPPDKTFGERLVEAAKVINREDVLLSDSAAKVLDDLASGANAGDIPLLAQKLEEGSKSLSFESFLAGLVLARLAREHDEAFNVLVAAARAENQLATQAIAHMEPPMVRRAGLALLKENITRGSRARGAHLLAIVGKKEDVPVLQEVLEEGNPLLAESCRKALDELQFKVEKVTAEQEAQWEGAGLEYQCIAMGHGWRTFWMDIAEVANSKGRAQLPIDYLRLKIGRREIFAVALAGFRKEPELVADLEKVATGDGTGVLAGMDSPSLVAMWSLAKIGTEETVNAILRASATWKQTGYRHWELARFAAEKGGPTTLPILKSLAEDEQFLRDFAMDGQVTDEVRKYYKDAIEKLTKRLETPVAPPANGEPASPPTNDSAPTATDTGQPLGPPNATGTGKSSEGGAEAPLAEATPFPWLIVGIVVAALAIAATAAIVVTRAKKTAK